MATKFSVTIYTDGSCLGNPGPGGWAARLIDNKTGRMKDISGGEPSTTNNKMELQAIIEALSALKDSCTIKLYSDSNYIIQAITAGWLRTWIRNGWRKSDRKPVANQEQWMQLLQLAEPHDITWSHVSAHVGIEHNEACDKMARAQSAAQKNHGTAPEPMA